MIRLLEAIRNRAGAMTLPRFPKFRSVSYIRTCSIENSRLVYLSDGSIILHIVLYKRLEVELSF